MSREEALRIVLEAARIWADEYGGLDRNGDVTEAITVLEAARPLIHATEREED